MPSTSMVMGISREPGEPIFRTIVPRAASIVPFLVST